MNSVVAGPDRRVGLSGMALLGGLIYFVLLGGTTIGEVHPALRAVNAAIGAAVVGSLLFLDREEFDRVDLGVLGAALLMAIAGTLSLFPRQSFDAALACLVFASAFVIGRRLMGRGAFRSAFERLMMLISILITAYLVALWLLPFLELWALSDWALLPSLGGYYTGGAWGHRYDAALLLILLYPAWWVGRPSRARRVAAIVIGLMGMALLLIVGSRTVWLAAAAGVAVVALPVLVRLVRRDRRVAMAGLLGLLLVGVIGSVTGLLAALGDRLLATASAEYRVAMWGPLIDLWREHPVGGVGPGSFPWALQLTPYFDTNSFTPRHPDSVVFQLLPEAGLLGVAALVVVLLTALPPLLRSGSPAVLWVVAALLAAAIGNNPTDFGFLVVIAIAWAAYALPRKRAASVPWNPRHLDGLRVATAVGAILLLIAHGATVVAAFAYEEARVRAERGDFAPAIDSLTTAISLDPGMAMYMRQRGALLYAYGAVEASGDDLRRAVEINPADDAAWRGLAVALQASGDGEAAAAAAERAVSVQRADPLNLLTAAALTSERNPAHATELLADLVRAWPAVVAASGWMDLLPPGVTTSAIVAQAFDDFLREGSGIRPETDEPLWLGVMAGQVEPVAERLGLDLKSAPVQARLASLGCDAGVADTVDVDTSTLPFPAYWIVRQQQAALTGKEDPAAVRALRLIAGRDLPPPPSAISPTQVGLDTNADRWGYRRNSMSIPAAGVMLPVVEDGVRRWLADPQATADRLGLGQNLERCGNSGRR